MRSPQIIPRLTFQSITRLTSVAVAFLVPLSGCAEVQRRNTPYTQQRLPSDLAAYYAYPRQRPTVTVQRLREDRYIRESLVQFPMTVTDFQPTEPLVEFEWFESKLLGRRAAILLNPILGGDYPLERGICRHLARHGFHVALVHRKTLKISPEHPVSHLELLLRQGIFRIRQIVDWMEVQECVDPQRMGSFGISMGGMASVMTAAIDPRLRVHVVALAGGSIPEVLVTSKDQLLTKPRARYLARNHIDLKTLEARLRDEVKTDPIRLAPYVDPHALLMFVALEDRTIGRANALHLWRALGQPHVVFMPFGHYTAYFALPYMKYASLRFFQQTLR